MIFVDTNVLLDIIEDAPTPAGDWSRRTFADIAQTHRLAANHIVAAELAGQVENAADLGTMFADAEIELHDLDLATAYRAGAAFREYRKRGGGRQTILADFLIAAHAEVLEARLLTRDRGLASYFPNLSIITPETHPNG